MNFKKRKRNSDFKPNQEFIDRAVENYLAEGNKIKRIIFDESSYQEFLSNSDPIAVDEYLSGE